jgi:phospholipid N-methyltransferase
MNRFVSLSTAEAILNELAPPGKILPKAFLENGALNSMDANNMLANALGHHDDLDISPDTVMVVHGIRPSKSPRFYVVVSFLPLTLFPAMRRLEMFTNEGE